MEKKEESDTIASKKRKLPSADRLLSLAALFVSASTLFILLYQTHLSNKMYGLEQKAQKMSVFPYLQVGPSYDRGKRYEIFLENNGIGPAMIKSIYVLYEDSVYAMDLAEFLFTEIGSEASLNFHYSSLAPGQLIPANERIKLVGNNDNHTAEQLFDIVSRKGLIKVAITYTSVYEDQTWTCFLNGKFPVPDETAIKGHR